MLALVISPDLGLNDDKIGSERNKNEEFYALSKAIDAIEVDCNLTCKISKIHAGTFFGKGKINQFKSLIDEKKIKLLLINCKLSPMQQRNLEKALEVKILDRTGLILEIFGDRAQTKEGVLQVDLAHLEYQKTRLVRSWTHLERQRGGIGFMGGPGETQIESDKRAINEKIVKIKKSLQRIVGTRRLQRANRGKNNIPVIALVGYTNTGKSSIFNRLTNSKVLEKDMLFATLDPKMRVFNLLGADKVILLDTVGFISDLPTHLINAFRGTLEEVVNSDIILHVRDISHKENRRQALDVENTLNSLRWNGNERPPIIEVHNKIDKLRDSIFFKTVVKQKKSKQNAIFLSAKAHIGFDSLQKEIKKILNGADVSEEVFVSFLNQRHRSWLFKKKIVNNEKITDSGYLIEVRWSKGQRDEFYNLL